MFSHLTFTLAKARCSQEESRKRKTEFAQFKIGTMLLFLPQEGTLILQEYVSAGPQDLQLNRLFRLEGIYNDDLVQLFDHFTDE